MLALALGCAAAFAQEMKKPDGTHCKNNEARMIKQKSVFLARRPLIRFKQELSLMTRALACFDSLAKDICFLLSNLISFTSCSHL